MLIKEPKQWVLKKSITAATRPLGGARGAAEGTGVAKATGMAAQPPPLPLAGIKPAVRCCLGGWADPMPHHILGNSWCKAHRAHGGLDVMGRNRTAHCAESARRTAWYTRCLPTTASPLQQRSCSGASKLSCPVYFACRGPIYNISVAGAPTLSGAPDRFIKPSGFA